MSNQKRNIKNAMTNAYEKGNRHLFDALIAGGTNFNCHHGFKLLLENCKKQEMDDLEFLLKNGAPTRGHDKDGMCPLMEASQNGHIEKVRMLLRYSLSELNKRNKHGFSSLRCSLCLQKKRRFA
jgi:ankyrin repeat protein